MIRRPPRSTRTDHSFPTRRSSDLAAQRDHGSVAPKPKGRAPGTAGKLTAHIAFLLARMKSEPDTTLQELADVLREDRAKPDPWDETSVKTSLTRLRGRAPVGERLYGTDPFGKRSEEPTSELQSLMRSSYADFCLTKKRTQNKESKTTQ